MSRVVTDRGRATHVRIPAVGLALGAAVLAGCTALAPLREPPRLADPAPMTGVTTRQETVARFGPPAEVRASDVGEVLVYRRRAVVDVNPNRYYGEDAGTRSDRIERLLVHVDPGGKVVRWSLEPE